jgi:hypothetical protein
MHSLTAKRTIVKSPPELWSELSEVDRLARHLEAFGEIKITKLDPEHTVAWEGEKASGTVSIEPSGWGTKVTMTAHVADEAPAEVAEVDETAAEPPRPGFFARFFGRTVREIEPEPVDQAPHPEPEPDLAQTALEDALEALGSAHHRPFSRG